MAVTRRSFLRRALASGVAVQGLSLGIARDLLARPSGQPIIIGHQCDLTGGFSSSAVMGARISRMPSL